MISKIRKALSKKEPKVYVVRHGATDFNGSKDSADRIRGWINVPLNDNGRQDAEKAGRKLNKEDVDLIFSSDLDRAEETAEIINEHQSVEIIIDSDLRPWGLGVFQGQETSKILDQLNHLIDDEDVVPEEGESFRTFRTRYLKKLKHIVDLAIKNKEVYVVVSHFRNLKTYDSWREKGFPADFSIDEHLMKTDTFKTGEVVPFDIKAYLESKV